MNGSLSQFDLLDLLKKKKRWMTRNELLIELNLTINDTEKKKMNRKLKQLMDSGFVDYELNKDTKNYHEYKIRYRTQETNNREHHNDC